jgi:hypothetical protein
MTSPVMPTEKLIEEGLDELQAEEEERLFEQQEQEEFEAARERESEGDPDFSHYYDEPCDRLEPLEEDDFDWGDKVVRSTVGMTSIMISITMNLMTLVDLKSVAMMIGCSLMMVIQTRKKGDAGRKSISAMSKKPVKMVSCISTPIMTE